MYNVYIQIFLKNLNLLKIKNYISIFLLVKIHVYFISLKNILH